MPMQKRGWDVGIFLTGVTVKKTPVDDLLSRAEAVEGGEMIVYSIVNARGGDGDQLRCQIGVFSKSLAECKTIAECFY